MSSSSSSSSNDTPISPQNREILERINVWLKTDTDLKLKMFNDMMIFYDKQEEINRKTYNDPVSKDILEAKTLPWCKTVRKRVNTNSNKNPISKSKSKPKSTIPNNINMDGLRELSVDDLMSLEQRTPIVYVKSNGEEKSGLFIAYYEESGKIRLQAEHGRFRWYLNPNNNRIFTFQ